jgi:ABC-type spermidine/putrescine transport system permease subunit II
MTTAPSLWRYPGTGGVTGAALLFLYMPIVALILLSFNDAPVDAPVDAPG